MVKVSSFVDLVKSQQTGNLFLVTASDNDRPCWFYLDIDKNKVITFERKVKEKTPIDLEEWGRVIISGWGEEPPLKVKEKIKVEGAGFSLTPQEVEQELFYLTSVSDDGAPFYSFVTVPLYLADEFRVKCAKGGFDYRDYGAIVYSDWGLYPTERVLMLMEMDYNLNRSTIADRLPEKLPY